MRRNTRFCLQNSHSFPDQNALGFPPRPPNASKNDVLEPTGGTRRLELPVRRGHEQRPHPRGERNLRLLPREPLLPCLQQPNSVSFLKLLLLLIPSLKGYKGFALSRSSKDTGSCPNASPQPRCDSSGDFRADLGNAGSSLVPRSPTIFPEPRGTGFLPSQLQLLPYKGRYSSGLKKRKSWKKFFLKKEQTQQMYNIQKEEFTRSSGGVFWGHRRYLQGPWLQQ